MAVVVAVALAIVVVAVRGGDDAPAQGSPTSPAAAAARGSDHGGSVAGEESSAADPVAAAPTTPEDAPAEQPGLPDKPPVLATTSARDEPLWTAFDEERRDDAWAGPQEEAIRTRLRGLLDAANHRRGGAVAVPKVECRAENCRLLVTGTDEAAFRTFLESMQDERGFFGTADLMALDAYGTIADKKTGNDQYVARVHLHYTR
jgi:hypothetical protein